LRYPLAFAFGKYEIYIEQQGVGGSLHFEKEITQSEINCVDGASSSAVSIGLNGKRGIRVGSRRMHLREEVADYSLWWVWN
jgi:hypothetical protein